MSINPKNMRKKILHQLLFNAVSTYDLEKFFGLSRNDVPKKFNSASIHRTDEKETFPRSQQKSDDWDLLLIRFILRIFEYQSDETLKLKQDILSNKNAKSDGNSIPDEMHETDCLKWAREVSWTLVEAAFLSMGFVPNTIVTYDFKKTERVLVFITSPFIAELNYRHDLLQKHSFEAGLNNASPLDFIRWFQSVELSVPKNLVSTIKRLNLPRNMYGEVSEDHEKKDALHSLERKTLLKLIAAMSIQGYKFDPNAKRNDATADIQSDLELLGIPLDQKTILKWLRVATATIDESNLS